MKVCIFHTFGLKTPIYAPKIGVLEEFDPVNGERYQRIPEKAHPSCARATLSSQITLGRTCSVSDSAVDYAHLYVYFCVH